MAVELLGIIAPVFVCVLLGFAWRGAGRGYPTEFVTDLVTNLGAPSLVFSSLTNFRVEISLMTELMGAAALAVLAFGVLGAIALAVLRLPRTSLLAPLMFPNAGNLALPLSLFAFGAEGLALATSVFAMIAILHFTLGIWIWTGTASTRALLTAPVSWATLLALGVILSGVTLPIWIARSTELLGQFTIPLMLLTLGASLSGLRVRELPLSLGIGTLRIGMGIAVGFAISAGLGLDGTARGVFVIACAGPSAVFNYLFAERYERNPAQVASVVLVSTLLSLLTYPLLIGVLLD